MVVECSGLRLWRVHCSLGAKPLTKSARDTTVEGFVGKPITLKANCKEAALAKVMSLVILGMPSYLRLK